LIVVYLDYLLTAFVVRLATSPQRGFHELGLFRALWVSGSAAMISLALVTLIGVPLAFVLGRSKSRLASVVGLVVQIPLALPPLMSGIVLVYVIGPYTYLGRHFGEHLTASQCGVNFCSRKARRRNSRRTGFRIFTSRASRTDFPRSSQAVNANGWAWPKCSALLGAARAATR
jgi:hypothetical protein